MDRRQKKTRRSIYEAFESLMQENHYSQITVAQIIDRADIGRSTFYAHFETKDDLLDQMCNEMFEHVFEGVNEECITHANLQASDLKGVIAHLLYHLRDTHRGICGKLLCENEPHFTAYFDAELRELFQRKIDFTRNGVPMDLRLTFLSTSLREAIGWWFRNDAKNTPEEIAAWYLRVWGIKE